MGRRVRKPENNEVNKQAMEKDVGMVVRLVSKTWMKGEGRVRVRQAVTIMMMSTVRST